MTDLLIGDETFRIEVDGDATKPALLLMHSLGSDLSQWDVQMPALLKSFRVIRYDSRGHGGSTLAGAPYSIARLGRDALGILDALEIETAHVMGVSMGGAVAQWLLAYAPRRISRAVLANTTARFGATESWNSRIVAVLGNGMSGLADGTMARWFGDAFAAREPKQIEAMRAIFEATAPEGYAGCCAAIRDLDLREALHAVAAPVLVISGRDDPSFATTDVAHLVATIPGAKHVALEARHISNIEADAAFTKAVVAFLTAKLPTKKAASPPAPAGAKAIVTRRVGTRRSTAARIPLTAAPTSATASKTPARKVPAAKGSVAKGSVTKAAAVAPKSTAKKTPVASVRKPAASPAPAKRATNKPAAKPTAPVEKPVAEVAAKAAPAKKAAAPKPVSKVAKRPSAKTLKAMASGTAAKSKAAKAVAPKAGKAPAKLTPLARKAKTTIKLSTRAAGKSVATSKSTTKAKTTKAPVAKAPVKTAARNKSVVKAPAKTVSRKAPARIATTKSAPKKAISKTTALKKIAPKTAAKSGRRAS